MGERKDLAPYRRIGMIVHSDSNVQPTACSQPKPKGYQLLIKYHVVKHEWIVLYRLECFPSHIKESTLPSSAEEIVSHDVLYCVSVLFISLKEHILVDFSRVCIDLIAHVIGVERSSMLFDLSKVSLRVTIVVMFIHDTRIPTLALNWMLNHDAF